MTEHWSMCRLGRRRTRSISAENRSGAPGAGGRATDGTGAGPARDLGVGWKVSPSLVLPAGSTTPIAVIEGPGVLTHLWLTTHRERWRSLVLRIHWDDAEVPAVAAPLGDFFCQGWGRFAQVSSAVVAVNPHGGMNAYWEMPFRTGCRISVENLATDDATLYFQVDYEVGDVPDDAAYLHTRWRRSNPLGEPSVHTILDGARGPGHYVGTYLAWGVNSSGWWGEGELKFYLDGDDDFPTICGTGTEDYVGGAWNFDVPGQGYTPYSTAYLGLPQVIAPDGRYDSQQRFGMYRWHLPDPIRFTDDLRVTVQALGWRSGGRYLPLHDDIASTAWWYSSDPQGVPSDVLVGDDLEIC